MISREPFCGMTARQLLRMVMASGSRRPCRTCLSMYTSAPAGTDCIRSASEQRAAGGGFFVGEARLRGLDAGLKIDEHARAGEDGVRARQE